MLIPAQRQVLSRAEQRGPRLVATAALVAGALMHLVGLPGPTTVLFWGFLASALGMGAGAVLLVLPAPRLGWLIGGGTALLTFVGYILTRTTGLPGITNAIGKWLYPLGVPSLVVEAVAFLLAVWALTDRYGLGPVAREVQTLTGRTLPPAADR